MDIPCPPAVTPRTKLGPWARGALWASLLCTGSEGRADPRRPTWAVPALHAVGLLGAQRVGAMLLWPRAFSLENTERDVFYLRYAYTHPPRFDPRRDFFEWDGDRWSINVIGHGLMGSELYLRARQCDHSPWVSLLFTAVASTVWEYGVEVYNAHPSLNDLVWTPLAGALVGELRYVLHRAAGGFSPALRVIVRGVVDPFGSLERAAGAGC